MMAAMKDEWSLGETQLKCKGSADSIHKREGKDRGTLRGLEEMESIASSMIESDDERYN